jgi:hypothetical protein
LVVGSDKWMSENKTLPHKPEDTYFSFFLGANLFGVTIKKVELRLNQFYIDVELVSDTGDLSKQSFYDPW